MSSPVNAVIEFLESELERGRTHIPLDADAKQGLRDLHRRSKMAALHSPQPQAAQASAPTSSQPLAERPSIPEGSKEEKIEALKHHARTWPPSRSLDSLRDTMVFSTGNPDARIVLVGEAPGYEEERQEEPFVGPAGRKLNDILKAMNLSREEVYITNIVKFRPSMPRQTTNNRKPTPEEMDSCIHFIRQEISIVEPECIIALGGTAGEGLLKLSGPVRNMRSSWHEFEGIPAKVTYHPSYLLQSGGTNHVKRQLWEDMLAVMEKLSLPISERQKGFFLPKP